MNRYIRKAKRWIRRNWHWIVIGTLLTAKAVDYSYQERGYMAYGGEWLVLPVIGMVVWLARDMRRELRSILSWEGEESREERIARDRRRVQSSRPSYQRRRSGRY